MTKKTKDNTLIADQESLARGLGLVARAVSPRSTLPVLGNILLKPEDNLLRLTGSNLELTLSCWVGAQGFTEPITLPGKTLVDLVNTLPPGPVEIKVDPALQRAAITSGKRRSQLKGIDALEFPNIPQADGGIELDGATLTDALREVVFAAATETHRPILTGIHFQFDKAGLTLETTDGSRAVRRTISLNHKLQPLSLIVPARAAEELLRNAASGPVWLAQERGNLIIGHDVFRIACQLIEGVFPSLDNIIPKRCKTVATLDAADFRALLRCADVMAREAGHRVTLSVGSKTVSAKAQALETGNVFGAIDAEIVGSAMDITINAGQLIEALNITSAEQITLGFTTPANPILFQQVGRDDFTHIVMPLLS